MKTAEKPKYQFVGRSFDGKCYVWVPVGMSLAPVMYASIDWFWAPTLTHAEPCS